METNLKHFHKMQEKRFSNHARLLKITLGSYTFYQEKFENKVHDSLYFQLTNEDSALKILDEVGLMFPYEAQLSRKSYYEKYKNQKIGILPYGYRLAIYFLIDNGYAEEVL